MLSWKLESKQTFPDKRLVYIDLYFAVVKILREMRGQRCCPFRGCLPTQLSKTCAHTQTGVTGSKIKPVKQTEAVRVLNIR